MGWVGDSCVPKWWPEISLRQPSAERKDFTERWFAISPIFQWNLGTPWIKSDQEYEVGRVAYKISVDQTSRMDAVRESIFLHGKVLWQVWRQRGIRRGFGQKLVWEFERNDQSLMFFQCNWLWTDGLDYTPQVNFLPVYHGIHQHDHLGMLKPEGIAVRCWHFCSVLRDPNLPKTIHFGTGR